MKLTPLSRYKRMVGSYRAGAAVLRSKRGIHALTNDVTRKNAKKGARQLKKLMQIKEYKKLHAMKIRYGRAKKKFNRLMWVEEEQL